MEAQDPLGTIPDTEPNLKGGIWDPYTIYYTLATSATRENRRFGTPWTSKTSEKTVLDSHWENIIKKEPSLIQNWR